MDTARSSLAPAVHATARIRGLALGAFVVGSLLALPIGATDAAPIGARVSRAKVALQELIAPAGASPAALCSARIAEGSSELELLCRHELGNGGEISIVTRDAEVRPGPALWTAPLASPFVGVAKLSQEALEALLAGQLAIRIDASASGGPILAGPLETPIFDSGFDFNSLCEWDNYPCSDGNICTYDYCSATGACSFQNHSVVCPLPHANGLCNNGICQIQSCQDDYSNCNITNTDGCEVNHRNAVVRPDDPENCDVDVNMIDNYAGDTVCGVICSSNFGNAHTFATRKGRGQAVFSALAEEKSSCLGSVEHRLDLIVPANVDYDLYVYRDCELVAWSTKQAGLQEVVTITEPETAQESDTFFYQIEVRYFDGASCVEWELQLTGYTC